MEIWSLQAEPWKVGQDPGASIIFIALEDPRALTLYEQNRTATIPHFGEASGLQPRDSGRAGCGITARWYWNIAS